MDPLRLVGTWDFRREVGDHRDGAEYTARGRAELAPEDDGRIRWAEHGTLTWSAGSTPVSRTLFLVRELPDADPAAGVGLTTVGPETSPGPWRVTFEDGRDFHPWTVGAVEHLCGRDIYEGGVEIPEEPAPPPDLSSNVSPPPPSDLSWELRWRVTGPEKDYTMRTTYSRRPR
ncbi:DUF6314 family protein [Promicromonospora sp. NPDC057138]|uniref:DUF6314 family protein n=1 Tax=Promicromonospora sp. NPDC057138 TaxID=3346031 RepID=UPI00362F6E94